MSFLFRRKGASIAELVVVIAVLAVISTIVVSFIVVANEKVRTGNERVNALNDIAVIESRVNAWFEEKSLQGYSFSRVYVGSDSNLKATLNKQDGTKDEITLSFVDNKLFDSKNPLPLYESSVITKVYFIVTNRSETNECLIICQITYEIQKTIKTDEAKAIKYEYSFALSNYKYLESNENGGGN